MASNVSRDVSYHALIEETRLASSIFKGSLTDSSQTMIIYQNFPKSVWHLSRMTDIEQSHSSKQSFKLQGVTYFSIADTFSVSNFQLVGNWLGAFWKRYPSAIKSRNTTRATSPKYFPLMYFSNLHKRKRQVSYKSFWVQSTKLT